jgi:HK97 family phage major capsid protein
MKINPAGQKNLAALIAAGKIDPATEYDFTPEAAAALLGEPPDWERYSSAHLGLDESAAEETAARYVYPFATLDGGDLAVSTAALSQISTAAEDAGEAEIAAAAQLGKEDIQGAAAQDAPQDTEGGEAGTGGSKNPNPTRALPPVGRVLFKPPAGMKTYHGLEVRTIRTGDILHRNARMNLEEIDLEARTVPVAFSSVELVDRYWGDEKLSHAPGAVRLDRLRDRAPVLVDHDTKDQVGVVVGPTVRIEADGRGRCVLRFGRSERATEIFQDIVDEIRCHVSVSYKIWDAVTHTNGPNGRDLVEVTDWEGYEISIAPVPADHIGSGVKRSASLNSTPPEPKPTKKEVVVMKPEVAEKTIEEILREDRERSSRIHALGKIHNCPELAEKFATEGKPEAEFHRTLLEKIGTPVTLEKIQERAKLGMEPKEVENYNILRAIEAQASGDWSRAGLERAAHLEMQKRCETPARGCLVPPDVLARPLPRLSARADIEYGDTASGAHLVGTSEGPHIDALRANSVLAKNGATILPGLTGNLHLPRLATGAAFYIMAEGGTGTESAMAWTGLNLQPWSIYTKVPVTRRMLKQSSPAVQALVLADIGKGMGIKVDYYGLRGVGTTEPRGILNQTGVGLVPSGTDGTVLAYGHVIDLETLPAGGNAEGDSMRYIVHPTMRGHMKQTEKAAGTAQFIWTDKNMVNGYPASISTQMPTGITKGANDDCQSLIYGAITEFIIGLWGGMDIVIDTTSRDDGGHIIKAFQEMDCGLRHAEAFAVMQEARAA